MNTRPPSVIVDRIGPEHAEQLSRIVGGTRLHVPGNLANASRLKALLGDDLAILVILHFGDSRLSVPLTTQGRGAQGRPVDIRKVKRLVSRGWSSSRIARHLGCSERSVEAKRAKLREPSTPNGRNPKP